MFDFKATIEEADQALTEGNFVLAVFDYWLIDFAFYDEEFPVSYTEEMGKKARKMFFKLLKKHKNEILESDYYREMKESLGVFESYRKYFSNFERVIRSLNNKHKEGVNQQTRKEYVDNKQKEQEWMFDTNIWD